jgi:hypothetical protein
MQATNINKINSWREHIAAAGKYPAGITAYCKEHNISVTMYYKWKVKLRHGEKPSAFLPVAVSAPQVPLELRSNIQGLPEAQWVAEVMLHLIRGL